MQIDEQKLRVEGVYRQNERGEYMQRVKLPGGILSLAQAQALADLANRHGSGTLHLTTRGSIEFHGLQYADLPEIHRGLAAVGLFSRGACGGAVRGISCSSSFGPGFGRIQVMLRHFLQHFSNNPYFEGLPKKFKIAFEAGYERSRHLIQDMALVLVEEAGGDSRYDVWLAGGLGRQPRAAFLYADRVAESELLPLSEAVIETYKAWGEKGRRLKHMLADLGEVELRKRIAQLREQKPPAAFNDAIVKQLLPAEGSARIPLDIFAGELPVANLTRILGLAREYRCDWFLVTSDQNLELLRDSASSELERDLGAAGFRLQNEATVLRVCPGNHECRMGLCATRDLARSLRETFDDRLDGRSLAISGCANSCAQPQLAEFGILASKLQREGEQRIPLFDLYRRSGDGLGEAIATGLTEAQLLARLEELL